MTVLARGVARVATVMVMLIGLLVVAGPGGAPPSAEASEGSFVPLSPARVLETRSGERVGNVEGSGAPRVLRLLGEGGVPSSGVGAVALDVTVTETGDPALGGGFVRVFPCGTRPDASNLNFVGGQTVANSVIAPVSSRGEVCFCVYGTAHVLADVSGFFPGAATTEPPVTTSPTTRPVDPLEGCEGVTQIPVIECNALVALYDATDGPNWENRDGWLADNRPFGWYGVICQSGSVRTVNLGQNGLTGAILPAEIGNLRNLERLSSTGGLISLPPEIGNLTRLTSLSLAFNELSALPVQLGNLTNLESLAVSFNNLEGDITAVFAPLRAANTLTFLNLSGNRCLTATDPGLVAWLNGLDPTWNGGC